MHKDFSSGGELYATVRVLLQHNAIENPIKSGPSFVFHNHSAADMVARYRLGADSEELLVKFSKSSNPVSSPEDTVVVDEGLINRGNWQEYMGCDYGLIGLGTHVHYKPMQHFFMCEIEARGCRETLQEYLPSLAAGIAGDLFHAVIELGYYFESKEPLQLASGLAWCATAYATSSFPEEDSGSNANTESASKFTSPHEALLALSLEAGDTFPSFELQSGSAGFVRAIEALATHPQHSARVLKYDLDWATLFADHSENTAEDIIMQICEAGAASFACTTGSTDDNYPLPGTDFYLLHLLTGARAVWAVITDGRQNGWSRSDKTSTLEHTLLKALWHAVLFSHVARNNAPISTTIFHSLVSSASGNTRVQSAQGKELRSWPEIVDWSRHGVSDSHITKAIFTCADFHDRQAIQNTQNAGSRFWHIVANNIMTANAGSPDGRAKLIGSGFGVEVDDPWCGLFGSERKASPPNLVLPVY